MEFRLILYILLLSAFLARLLNQHFCSEKQSNYMLCRVVSCCRRFNEKLHLVTREIWLMGMLLRNFLPLSIVDALALFLCYLKFGDTSKYGIHRPTKGPFYLKANFPIFPLIDVGTFDKIKAGEIQVFPSITRINSNSVTFANGKVEYFDAIILATGYRATTKEWLKGDDYLIDDDGVAKHKYPNDWKGKNGLFCAGLGRRGISGASEDALKIAKDIYESSRCE